MYYQAIINVMVRGKIPSSSRRWKAWKMQTITLLTDQSTFVITKIRNEDRGRVIDQLLARIPFSSSDALKTGMKTPLCPHPSHRTATVLKHSVMPQTHINTQDNSIQPRGYVALTCLSAFLLSFSRKDCNRAVILIRAVPNQILGSTWAGNVTPCLAIIPKQPNGLIYLDQLID